MTNPTTTGRAAGSAAGPDDDAVEAMDPSRILADADACAALGSLVDRLRAIRYDGSPLAPPSAGAPGADATRLTETWAPTIVALARGEVVGADAATDALGAGSCSALRRCGALAFVDGEAALTGKIFPTRSVFTLLPHSQDGVDVVYLGPDSVCLFEVVWAARGLGDRAVDLGTGNGFIAAALATRYDHVVAADLSGRCVATAALVPVLNPHLRGRYSAVQMDVSNGLQRGSFDLVTANAPWVPEVTGPDGGAPRRFAAGGPTGFELPRRFIDEAIDLLVPGGRAFIACSDIRFTDGRQPLVDHLRAVADRGLEVTTTETRINQQNDFDDWAQRKAPGALSARHLVVEIRRPR